MVATVVGQRYRITEKVGTGGMADVYKAVDEVLGRTVAVKVMHDKYASDPAFTSRFRQEAQAAANLQSPYIVNIYDWGQDGETYYIVMEYVRGTDLKSIIKDRGWLPSHEVAAIAAQVCAGLAVAHGYDIIHRDIKPHNIMVLPDGSVKVMDFGIAAAGNTTMTQTGSVLGTAHYVSPEQAQGKSLKATTDLYSLGVVLYEASTGRLPFDGDTPVAVALKQVNEAPIRPTRVNPAVDSALEAIIGRAMTKDPAARYQTAEDMRRDLLRVARTGASDATTITPAVGPAPGRNDATAVMSPVAGGGYGADELSGRGTRGGGPEIYEVPESNGKKYALWAGIAVAIILAGLGVAWAMGAFSGDKVTVPNLVGMPSVDAIQAIRDAGLEPGDITEENSDEAEPGTVLSQDPEADTSVAAGTKVNLVVSLGADLAEVPNLEGMTEDEARRAIEDAGFVPDPQPTEYNEEVPSGQIVSQSPEPGSMAPRGSAVAYVVSRGVETGSVPNVVGKKQADAQRDLEDAGFTVRVEEQNHPSVAKGVVISQNPGAGLTVGVGAEVVITVSLGPEVVMVTVPDLGDMTEASAKSLLKSLGLNARVSYVEAADASEDGRVQDQDPIPGTRVEKGSTVNISVGQLSE